MINRQEKCAVASAFHELARILMVALQSKGPTPGTALTKGENAIMCRLFSFSSPESYRAATRKVRIHGFSTSVRLEQGFWAILEQMAQEEGKSLGKLVTVLHDELREVEDELPNFTSCLRVVALHYGIAKIPGNEIRPAGRI